MSIHHAINTALVSRHMLEMNGSCYCHSCQRDDLDRKQIVPIGHVNAPGLDQVVAKFGGSVCWDCYDYTDLTKAESMPVGCVPCSDCVVGERGVKITDETTGNKVMDWCARCDGFGYVHGVAS